MVADDDRCRVPRRRPARAAAAVLAELLRRLRPRPRRQQRRGRPSRGAARGENRIDHLWIRVRDLAASRRFYEAVAPTVGLRVHDGPRTASTSRTATAPLRSFARDPVTENVHLAFPASDLETVEAFHRAALASGAPDNGAPGERPEYHPGYYGAYALDPDGNNVEAVWHDRQD